MPTSDYRSNSPAWDDGQWLGLPALDCDQTADACVIGLGGSGLTAIEELLAMGRSVIGIDAHDVGAGAAGRNGGLLASGTSDFHHDAVARLGRERAVRITQLTIEELHRIATHTPGVVRMTGSLRIAESDEELTDCVRQRDAMRADGFTADDYNGPLGRGISIAADAAFNPLMRCRKLSATLRAHHARLCSHTTAIEFGQGFVRTDRGRISCEQVIVAVDGTLERLFPELNTTVRTARLQMLGTAPAHEVTIPCPVSTRYGYDYFQQLPDGSVVLGGGRDKALETEWTHDGAPTAMIQDYLTSVLRDRLKVQAPILHRWAALVSYSSTGLPVLGEVRPGVWAAGGYSGTGNLMGALAGRAVARRAFGEETEFFSLLNTPARRN